jgi:hypothetical protein
MNIKSPHIPTSFGDENTEEKNKASGMNKLTTKTLPFCQKKLKSTLSKQGLRKKKQQGMMPKQDGKNKFLLKLRLQ